MNIVPQIWEPREYHGLMIDHIIEHKRCSLWADMGLGKTSGTLTALDTMWMCGYLTQPALVLGPLQVARNVWPYETKKWKHLNGIQTFSVIGAEHGVGARSKELAAALHRSLRTGNASLYTLNYDNIPWLVSLFEDNGLPWPFGIVIADESTRLKNLRVGQRTRKDGTKYLQGQGGIRARQLSRIAWKYQNVRWVNSTGTPAPNGYKDLWGQQWFIDCGRRLGRTYGAYMQRYFRSIPGMPSEAARYHVSLMPFSDAQIQDRLRDVTLTIRAKDYFDVTDPVIVPRYVDLSPKHMQQYKAMERDYFLQLESCEIEALNAASKSIKCLQIANGAIWDNPQHTSWTELHDEKLQMLESIIEECAGSPLLVSYWFKPDLARLIKRFPQGVVLDKKKSTEDDWNAGKIPLLFAHPDSAGHGLNLQYGGHRLAFYSMWWNLELFQQICERIGPVRQLQSGFDRPVYIYLIMARSTVDIGVHERLVGKAEVQDILKYAMRHKGFAREAA